MPYSRPTLAQIYARVKTDIGGALDSYAAFFRRSFERGVGGALSAVSHQLHGHLAWIALQIDPRTADPDIFESAHASPRGITKRAAVAAKLTITATGTTGTPVPAGTGYVRADGELYTTDALGTVTGGIITLAITAVVAGAAANCDDGDELTLSSPIAGLSTNALVASTVTDGSDIESDDELLARYLQRLQTPPRGGAPGDYVAWALEVPGVTRAWEYPRREGAGTVSIYVVNDALDPPTVGAGTIAEVAAYMDSAGRQPVTARAPVYTPTIYPLNMTINIAPNTPAVRAAITASLDATLFVVANPGGMTVLVSVLDESISITPGETDHLLVSPVADVVIPFGSLVRVGTITWGSI